MAEHSRVDMLTMLPSDKTMRILRLDWTMLNLQYMRHGRSKISGYSRCGNLFWEKQLYIYIERERDLTWSTGIVPTCWFMFQLLISKRVLSSSHFCRVLCTHHWDAYYQRDQQSPCFGLCIMTHAKWSYWYVDAQGMNSHAGSPEILENTGSPDQ